MARGFESKSVTSQQESAFGAISRERGPIDPVKQQRRELTRADLARQLEATSSAPRREALQKALEAIDSELSALDP